MNTFKIVGFCVVGLLWNSSLKAQTFEAADTLEVSELNHLSVQWVDLDNNLFYDLLLCGADSVGNSVIQVFLNEGKGKFTRRDTTFAGIKIHQLQPIDFDRNGTIDLAFSGLVNGTDSVVSILLNSGKGAFELLESPVVNRAVSSFEFADFDYDTRPDLLISQRNVDDSLQFSLLKGTDLGFEESGMLFPAFGEALSFALDLNSDSKRDLLLSGTKNGRSFTRVYKNEGNLELTEAGSFGFEYTTLPGEPDANPASANHQLLTLAVGEYDANGVPDMFVQGKTSEGTERNVLYRSSGTQVQIDRDSLLAEYHIIASHMADFDSDGATDLWVSAERNDSTFVFWYNNLTSIGAPETQHKSTLLLTAFADWDLDFNLDFAELHDDGDGLKLILFENMADSVNRGPSLPWPQAAVQTGPGEVMISWQSALDSLTDSSSLSYDLLLTKADSTVLFGSNTSIKSFGLYQPSHGNALYADHVDFNNLAQGDYLFLARAIDNAYNALGTAGGSPFMFSFAVCDADLVASSVELCPDLPTVFGEVGVLRNWYSDLYGALGQTELLSYTAIGEDTLYGTVASADDCSSGQLVYSITTRPLDPVSDYIEAFVQVCEESELTYELPASWTNITWISAALGNLGNGNSATFIVSQPDTLLVTAGNEFGCLYQAESVIGFFEPQVSDTLITISPGESAEVVASGGDSYEWLPASEFGDPTSDRQSVSPGESTDYQVLVKSDSGCVRQFNVRVEVLQPGGLPNLFTPNGDSRNDQFFLQLSAVPAQIDFRVYARSGGLVYRELDASRAVSEGWDGTHNGEKMPPGVYYWHVEGTYADGQPVLVDGKKSGKVNLVR